MTMKIQSISVVVPVYNEQDNVVPLVEEIEAALNEKVPYEIVMVNDASTDETKTVLAQAILGHPRLRVVSHLKNAGQSAAVVSGVKAAKYEWIATLDGDGQNNPADIPDLMAAVESELSAGASSVLCMGRRAKRNDRKIRKVSSRVANSVRQTLLKDDCPDSGCGIKVFNRRQFLNLPHFRNCHRFLPALFQRAGAKIINVPVSHRERLRGVSKYGVMNRLWVGIVDLFGVAWLMRRPVDVETEEHVRPS